MMTGQSGTVADPSALLDANVNRSRLTREEREAVRTKGNEFAELVAKATAPGDDQSSVARTSCLLIAGDLNSDGQAPEEQIRKQLLSAGFGYPSGRSETESALSGGGESEPASSGRTDSSGDGGSRASRTVNILLDSFGGSLDSAYKIVRYLSQYAGTVNTYVPRRAKSASTLVALGASALYMSPFGELGPLDAQIRDPRDPAKTMSALDCYQCVDYVRRFAFATMTEAQKSLSAETQGQLAFRELIGTASQFATNCTAPMLEAVTALDFGAWGRMLKIGEEYARRLLIANGRPDDKAAEIARTLVYGYTHHPFPIDLKEAARLELTVKPMDESAYVHAMSLLDSVKDKSFVGFISETEANNVVKNIRRYGADVGENTLGSAQAKNQPEDRD